MRFLNKELGIDQYFISIHGSPTPKKQFVETALKNFGSGWTWLAQKSDWKLEIVNTDDWKNLVSTDKKELLGFDVWEHSYYVDYRNDRKSYIGALWNIVNWDFVNSNMS